MEPNQFRKLINTILLSVSALIVAVIWGFHHLGNSMQLTVTAPPVTTTSSAASPDSRDTIVTLPNDKIGIVDGDPTVGGPFKQTIVIFQFDRKRNTFNLVGHYDYSKYMQNPVEYGLLQVPSN